MYKIDGFSLWNSFTIVLFASWTIFLIFLRKWRCLASWFLIVYSVLETTFSRFWISHAWAKRQWKRAQEIFFSELKDNENRAPELVRTRSVFDDQISCFCVGFCDFNVTGPIKKRPLLQPFLKSYNRMSIHLPSSFELKDNENRVHKCRFWKKWEKQLFKQADNRANQASSPGAKRQW